MKLLSRFLLPCGWENEVVKVMPLLPTFPRVKIFRRIDPDKNVGGLGIRREFYLCDLAVIEKFNLLRI